MDERTSVNIKAFVHERVTPSIDMRRETLFINIGGFASETPWLVTRHIKELKASHNLR